MGRTGSCQVSALTSSFSWAHHRSPLPPASCHPCSRRAAFWLPLWVYHHLTSLEVSPELSTLNVACPCLQSLNSTRGVPQPTKRFPGMRCWRTARYQQSTLAA